MKRFFCRTHTDNLVQMQDFIDQSIGQNVIKIKGEGRSQNGLSPWEYYYSSGLIDEINFNNIKEFSDSLSDNIFINWDSLDWSEIDVYYHNLYTEPPN